MRRCSRRGAALLGVLRAWRGGRARATRPGAARCLHQTSEPGVGTPTPRPGMNGRREAQGDKSPPRTETHERGVYMSPTCLRAQAHARSRGRGSHGARAFDVLTRATGAFAQVEASKPARLPRAAFVRSPNPPRHA